MREGDRYKLKETGEIYSVVTWGNNSVSLQTANNKHMAVSHEQLMYKFVKI